MEKKRAEREKQKLEKEEKKRQQQGSISDASSKPNKPQEEEEDIIGALMKEIRRGKTLRRRSEAQSGDGIRPNRPKANLKQDDILRVQKEYEKSVTESVKEEPKDAATASKPKVETKVDSHITNNDKQGTATKTVAGQSQLSVNYRKDRVKSEVFTGMQSSRTDQIRHSFHAMPHYETTV